MDTYSNFCKFNDKEKGVFRFLCENEWKKLSRFFELKNMASGENLWTEMALGSALEIVRLNTLGADLNIEISSFQTPILTI